MHLTAKENHYFDQLTCQLLSMPQFAQMAQYMQHGRTSCLAHSIAVAYMSYWLCRKLHFQISYKGLIRGALLHDFFLYDWHEKDSSHRWHGFHHPQRALDNADELFALSRMERQIIISHMWPLTLRSLPTCRAAVLVCLADKVCSLAETLYVQDHLPFYRHYDELYRSYQKESAACQA